MNRSDIRLVILLLVIILGVFIFIYSTKEKGKIAEVYFENEKILTIDLSIDKEYVVDGQLGDVVIEVKVNKIRVKEENSPKHICSKEGFIGDSSKVLVCLPNKIIIKVIGDNGMDGVVY